MASSRNRGPESEVLANRPLRMRDLTEHAGLSRQAIHFYIAEGLLPPPVRSGRNAAEYSPEHLERLHWIQQLQREHFLSLDAIKAVLNGDEVEEYSPQQKALLRRVRDQLPGWARPEGRRGVKVASLTKERISENELNELADAGLIDIDGAGKNRTMSQDDCDIVDCFLRYREAGATRERGYRPSHLLSMDKAIQQLVDKLAHLYAVNWKDAPVDEAVAFVEAVIPIDERLMVVLLRKKVRSLIERISEEASALPAPKSSSRPRRTRRGRPARSGSTD
jgi:DNA-binding transcriptional MerR regulator